MPRTDTAMRRIAAPSDRIYRALVDPDALVRWLPPGDMTAVIERFDLRPGGGYRMTLTHPDAATARGKSTATSDIVSVEFVDLVPETRVAYAAVFASNDPAFSGAMTMTWDLTPAGRATDVSVTATNVPDAITEADHLAGMASSLAKLDQFVQQA